MPDPPIEPAPPSCGNAAGVVNDLVLTSLEGGRVGIAVLRFFGLLFLAVALLVALGVVFSVGSQWVASGRAPLWVFPLVAPLIVLIFGVVMLRLRDVFLRRIARSAASAPNAAEVVECLQNGIWVRDLLWSKNGAMALARELLANGHSGLTLRAGPPKLMRPIRPLEVYFEPLPLDEAQPTVEELWQQATGGATSETDSAFRRPAASALRKTVLFSGGWRSVTGLLFAVCFLLLLGWGGGGGRAIAIIVASLVLVRFAYGWKSGAGNRILIVPGGILQSSRAGLQLFRRTECVLLSHRHQKHPAPHVTLVGSAGRKAQFVTTTRELDTLLAAWLSPVEPPTPELIAQLRGD